MNTKTKIERGQWAPKINFSTLLSPSILTSFQNFLVAAIVTQIKV